MEEEVFARWMIEHNDVIYRCARRLLGDAHRAEDIVQDTFGSAWKSRHLFDHQRNEKNWLLSIMHRRAADYWRSCEKFQLMEHPTESGVNDVDPFDHELTGEMVAALERLPVEIKETFLLVVLGDMTHSEAARHLGIPVGTVLSRVSRARTRMHEYLRK
jgi:RNA polymerase sigma-70 factor (ECF subfamily)